MFRLNAILLFAFALLALGALTPAVALVPAYALFLAGSWLLVDARY